MLDSRPIAAADPSPSRTSRTDVGPRQRARRTNNPLADIDTNTARGRRTADLVRAYLAILGNPAEIERQAAIIAAAELQTLAEEARTAALRDAGHADLDRVVRMQGAADRAVRRLGIKPGQPSTPSLVEHLARRAAARASEPDQAA
jgi:hypothetical protein